MESTLRMVHYLLAQNLKLNSIDVDVMDEVGRDCQCHSIRANGAERKIVHREYIETGETWGQGCIPPHVFLIIIERVFCDVVGSSH